MGDIANALEKSQIKHCNKDHIQLETFQPELVMKMVKAQKFDVDFSFFPKALHYAKLKKSMAIVNALCEVKLEYTGYKNRFKVEKKKSEAFANALTPDWGPIVIS